MTSLASQLNALKIQQRDEISLPTRTRVSFLFDIKQAANIDDQTLFFMCQAGLKHLSDEIAAFANLGDILHEKSLDFYRGTLTRDQLKPIDDRIGQLIRILSIQLIDQNAQKVLEYLLRIYEVHVYHKEQILNAFLPYFETAYFLKMSQCLNLKDDQVYGFLHQFAYQGVAIDRTTLTRCLGHNSGQAFQRYSDFAFNLLDLADGLTDSNPHWKFFGTMLVEVLRADPGNHTLMFNILPYVSKALRQPHVRDLKIAGLFAIGQICCRKSLSAEYTRAFWQQVLQTISDSSSNFQFDEDLKLKGMTIILLIAQNQNTAMPYLNQNDLLALTKVPRTGKLIQMLSQQFDTSALASLVFNSLMQDSSVLQECQKVMESLLQDNLQATFTVTQLLILEGVKSKTADETRRAKDLLMAVRDVNKDVFSQSCIFTIKQLADDPEMKEKAFSLLSEHSGQSKLVAKFGDKEYTLLSALGSNRKATRTNALSAISDIQFVEALSKNERELVKVALLQLINQETNDESSLSLMIKAIYNLIKVEKTDNHDSEFESLETLLSFVASKRIAYSSVINESLTGLLVKLKVEKPVNQHRQALLSITGQLSGAASVLPQNNKFSYLILLNNKDNPTNQLSKQMLQKPQQSIQLLVAAFQKCLPYLDYNHLISLLQRLIVDTKEDMLQSTLMRDLYPTMLSSFKEGSFVQSEKLLMTVLSGVPKLGATADVAARKCVSKIYGAAIYQKQITSKRQRTFDLSKVMAKFESDLFQNNVAFAEFLVQTAMHSSNEAKRCFAIMHLSHKNEQVSSNKGFCVNFEVMIGALLVLFNDKSTLIRGHAANLAEKYLKAYEDAQGKQTYIEVFTTTDKPASIVKKTSAADQKGKATPMIDTNVLAFITELVKSKQELINDRNQLTQVLIRHKRPENFDKILKTLLDYPTFELKAILLEAIERNPNHSLAFAMNLSSLLNKIFAQLEQPPVLAKGQLQYLMQVGKLIQSLHSQQAGVQQQLTISLIFPFLRFCIDHDERIPHEGPIFTSLTHIALEMFDKCILTKETLTKIEDRDFIELTRLYVDLQSTLLRKDKNGLKDIFVERHQLFNSQLLANALTDLKLKYKKEEATLDEVDFFIETMLQISKASEKLQESALQLLELLVGRLSGGKSQGADVAYTIELVSQLVKQTEGKQSAKSAERISSLAEAAFDNVKKAVRVELSKDGDKTFDPFDEFLRGQQEDAEMEETDQLLPSFQIFLCLFNALPVASAQTHLHKVSALLRQVTQLKNAKQSSLHKQVASHLFYLYQSIVLKTAKAASGDFEFKNSLADFLETASLIMAGEFSQLIGDGQPVLNVIRAAGMEYSAVACLILVSLASNGQGLRSEDIGGKDRSSPSIYLAFKAFQDFLEVDRTLRCLESLMFILQSIPITSETEEFIAGLVKLVFNNEDRENLHNCGRWIYEDLLGKKDANVRKFLYLAIFLLEQWLETNVELLAQIAGSEQSTQGVQSQFMNTFLASYILKESFSHAINLRAKNDKTAHRSLVRLSKLNDQLQVSLNQMLSLQIHVSIILRILEFGTNKRDQKTLLSLKTNSVSLLIEKISSYQHGFLGNASSLIQQSFRNLVHRAIEILQQNLQAVADGNNDSSQLSQCLFVLLSRTACGKTFNDQTQQSTLKIVQDYQKVFQLENKSMLQLQTQLISTEMAVFEAYSFSVLEHLQAFFTHVSNGFAKVTSVGGEQAMFADTFKFSLLKASITIAQIFLKFLNVGQLEQLITHVILAADISKDRRDTDLVAVVLDSISRESKYHSKLLVQATFNSYTRVIAHDSAIKLNCYGWRYFAQLLRPMLANLPKDFIGEHSRKLLKFLKQTLALPHTAFKQGFALNDEIEDAIVMSLQAFVVKLNEEQLRPFITSIVKWAMKQKDAGFNVFKATMLCQVLAGIVHSLKEFFVPLFGLYFEPLILEALKYLQEALVSVKQKGKRMHHQTVTQDETSQPAVEKLAIKTCELIKFTFKYDASAFIQADTFEKLCDPVANLLTCTGVTDFAGFVEDSVKPMIVEMNERINDDAMWIKLNLSLLMQTRSENWQSRLGALSIVEHMFDIMRERYLIILNDTIPFISESLEDENEEVESTAKRIVNQIEQLTGESINEYLK